jgi:hypothetical protein
MKTTILKVLLLFVIVLSVCACRPNYESIEKSLAGTWEYTINISYEGINYATGQSVSGTKTFSGTFTWDENLEGYLEGELEDSYSHLNGFIADDFLELSEENQLSLNDDSFYWSENAKKYEAFCDWKNIPVKYNMKEFTTESGVYAYVEIEDLDGSKIFCPDTKAILKARKIK